MLLFGILTCASIVSLSTSLPLPTKPQIWYQQGEIHALIHFNMASFAKDGDPGCSADNWNTKASYAVGPTSDPSTFQPKKLNTTQWADVMTALGAKGAILTAKHGCGHLLWPTKTMLPDGSAYPYCVGRNNSYIKQDVLALFQKSMTAANIRHGFYYSLTNNFFLNVLHHKANASPNVLKGQQNVTQAQFESIALAQVSELWTNYGSLGEIWFDGGYTSDMQVALTKVLENQKDAIGFGGCSSDSSCISPNPSTWIGTESGEGACPDGLWSTGNVKCGDPKSLKFITKTCDTTLQNNDHWFWTPPATAIRNLDTMIEVYHDTVGNNGVMELDFAIDRDGLVAPEHEALYRSLGAWIKSCYGTPVIYDGSSNIQLNATTWQYTIALQGHDANATTTVDRVVMREDITHGQRVRSWKLMVDKVMVSQGTSIGNRRVTIFNTTQASTMTLTVEAVDEPQWLQVDIFAPCP